MTKLSRQQTIIIEALRPMKWVCGSAWLGQIKDDRARISSLNRGYMFERGYKIAGEPCKGTACGRRKCPLFKRQAQKLTLTLSNFPYQPSPQYKDN